MHPNLPAAHISPAAVEAAANVPALLASLPAGYHTSEQLRAIQYAIAANVNNAETFEALANAYARAILSRFSESARSDIAAMLSNAFAEMAAENYAALPPA